MTTTEEKEQMELERQLQESGLEGRATCLTICNW